MFAKVLPGVGNIVTLWPGNGFFFEMEKGEAAQNNQTVAITEYLNKSY